MSTKVVVSGKDGSHISIHDLLGALGGTGLVDKDVSAETDVLAEIDVLAETDVLAEKDVFAETEDMRMPLVPVKVTGAGTGCAGSPGGAAAAAANLINPMGSGRPFIPAYSAAMDANQVADLKGGRPGPVPMDNAQESLIMGHTPDQIADILVVSDRSHLGAAVDMATANALAETTSGGGTGSGGNNQRGGASRG